jgi:hypothetical protein
MAPALTSSDSDEPKGEGFGSAVLVGWAGTIAAEANRTNGSNGEQAGR